ncbi:pentapeptide repeat-containing protein [uncultured Roseobacter sp.]|uniref:pentapeptide repeat-containing protein n=1 Tax=uncultured Roseobacter sp. TaxID=114847 RepID=UPI002618358A|nr:pentapeptide repeat-containing protein [uncultured Roseobacter sp.]
MRNDRADVFFIVAALTLVIGVPVALFAVYYFAESVQLIAAGVLLALVIVAAFGLMVARYKDQIFAYLLQKPARFAADLSEPASSALDNYAQGDSAAGKAQLEIFFRGIVTHYTWVQTRRWILAAATGLLIGFGTLVGSALLKQQNDLITRQNSFFQEQIAQQQRQLELQQAISNQTIRSEAIRRIYGSEFAGNPRVKAEALRSLLTVERLRAATDENSLVTGYINLHDADLSRAWLENADLEKVSWRGSTLDRTNFSLTRLSDAVFMFNRLRGAAFLSSDLTGANFAFSDLSKAVLAGANLSNAMFNQSDLTGADLSGVNLSETSFYRVNLSGADLQGIEDWRNIAGIEETNIFGIRNAPEGFMEWALSNGAISEEGALSDLWERGEEERAVQETVD